MTSNETLEFEQILFQISRLAKGKFSVSTELGLLSMLDIQTLLFLKDRDDASMGEIAEFLNIELPSSTSLINKLVRNKLVRRLPDRNDRRVVMIYLTETGNKLLKQAMEVKSNQTKQVLSYLSSSQKEQLLTILKTVKRSLEN